MIEPTETSTAQKVMELIREVKNVAELEGITFSEVLQTYDTVANLQIAKELSWLKYAVGMNNPMITSLLGNILKKSDVVKKCKKCRTKEEEE